LSKSQRFPRVLEEYELSEKTPEQEEGKESVDSDHVANHVDWKKTSADRCYWVLQPFFTF
jgi:hypothetical protein